MFNTIRHSNVIYKAQGTLGKRPAAGEVRSSVRHPGRPGAVLFSKQTTVYQEINT